MQKAPVFGAFYLESKGYKVIDLNPVQTIPNCQLPVAIVPQPEEIHVGLV